MRSNSSSSLPARSIAEVISSLRTSFRDLDFKEAETELKAREEFLRRDYDALEVERSDLSLQVLQLEEERRRLRRECEINDDKLSDLARKLSVTKEREEKAIRRYERSLNDIRVMEREKEEVLQMLQQVQSSYFEIATTLMDEMDVSRRDLKETTSKMNSEVKKLKDVAREKEEKLKEVVNKNGVLQKGKRDVETELEGLRRKVEVLERGKSEAENKLDELQRENEYLVAAKAKSDEQWETWRKISKEKVSIKEIRKKNYNQLENLGRPYGNLETGNAKSHAYWEEQDKISTENEERIQELMKKIEGLEMEKSELMKAKRDAISKYKQVEQQVLKLEEDVANWLLLNVPTDKKLMSAQIGKVICEVIKALDSEEDGVNCNAGTDQVGNIPEGASVASHINEPTYCLETDMIYEAAVRRTSAFETDVPREKGAVGIKREDASSKHVVLSDTEVPREKGAVGIKRVDASSEHILLSDAEVPREDGAIGIKRDASSKLIVLCDTDSDDENPICANEIKRQRVSSQCWNQRNDLDETSDDSLKSSCKFKKLMDLPVGNPKHKPSIAASGSRSDNKFVTPQKQVVTSLRQCNEVHGDKAKGFRSHGMVDDGNSQHNNRSPQANVFCSPQARELIASCRRSRLQ